MKKMEMEKELSVISPISGFGQKETDEEPLRVCRKRKSKQVAATLDSAVETRRSSRIRGLSNRRNDRSEGKLNSINFECYLENMWRELPEDKKNSFACLDSMWFVSYRNKHYKSKVLRWIKSKDIFSKKYVFVPIVLWDHWCLLIFCHLDESLESESTTPCMLLLDSLQMADPSRFAPEIRKFVSGIFNNEERPESPQLIKKIPLLVPKMKEDWFTPDQLESFWQELQTVNKDSESSDGSISGFGQKESDVEPLRVYRKRKSKQVAATLDAAIEPRRSSRIHGLSNSRNNRSVEKLNSIDFDRYLENMWRELPEDKKNSFACLDSMWFSLYRTKDYKPEVLRWIKSKDIFSKKYVFVPIVLWGHWCLLIFCHLGESLESKSTIPCMLLLDSMQTLRFEPEIRKFVSGIFNNEERPESPRLIKKIRLLVPKVPQQRNDIDCGKFVLYYISLFLESAPATFSISEGYPYFMKEGWFTPDQLESFWQELQTVTKAKDSESSDGSISGSEDVICLDIEKETKRDM